MVAPRLWVGAEHSPKKTPAGRWRLVVDLYGVPLEEGEDHRYREVDELLHWPFIDGEKFPEGLLEAAVSRVAQARAQGHVLVHCFPNGTLIEMATGVPKPIEDVKDGDMVISSDGKPHRVLATMSRKANGLLKVRMRGNIPIQCTPEHPLLVLRVPRWASSGSKKESWTRNSPDEGRLEWVEAKDLTPGDCLVRPFVESRRDAKRLPWAPSSDGHKKSLHVNDVEPSEDMAWVFGMYIADGGASKYTVSFTLSPKDDVGRLVEGLSHFGLKAKVRDCVTYKRVIVNSKTLSENFKEWFGHDSIHKRVPEFLMSWNQQKVLDGLMAGDGYVPKKRNFQQYWTTSPVLSRQVWNLLVDSGRYPQLSLHPSHSGMRNPSPIWRTEWRESRTHHTYRWNGFYCMPIISVEDCEYEGNVYNFEVEETNDYIAGGVVAHNCQAGLSRSASTAYACLRLLDGLSHQEAFARVYCGEPDFPRTTTINSARSFVQRQIGKR
jgi:hypothetical protein